MIRILNVTRRHLIAFIALVIALAGTSYAASVVADHSLTPAKLDPRFMGGYVRAWASISASGRVLEAGTRPTVRMQRSAAPGDYIILWHAQPGTGCSALASIDARGIGASGPIVGYALPVTGDDRRRGEESVVHTYNSQAKPAALPFDVVLVCATPH